jgi:hypothetical protein
MDLLKEALEPRWVTVQVTPAAGVRAMSLDDTAGPSASGAKPTLCSRAMWSELI